MDSVDSLAEFRSDEHLGSLSSSTLGDKRWRRVESNGDTSEEKVKVKGCCTFTVKVTKSKVMKLKGGELQYFRNKIIRGFSEK